MLHALSISKKGSVLLDFDRVNISKNFYWIDVINPNSDEINKINRKIKISLNDLKYTLDSREKPRVDIRDKYSLIILRATNGTSISPIGVIVSKHFIITIHKDEIPSLKSLIEQESHLHHELNHIVYEIILGLIRDFSRIIEDLDIKLDHVEEKAIKLDSNMEQMFVLKKSMIYLRKALTSNREVIEIIVKGNVPLLKEKDMFNMMFIEISQLIDTEELIKDRLTSVLEIHLSSISNKLNEVMKSFTVIASLLLMPMLITGIYGMNFRVLPLSQSDYGFWISLGIMILSVTIMLLFFKLRKWI
ncbi:magnesium transporter CorA family protein [Candidatus Woesearchaeota archaeon]|nr:magnesium transporter CorA family protein [Candidatus Woesearchaeota archaeon]